MTSATPKKTSSLVWELVEEIPEKNFHLLFGAGVRRLGERDCRWRWRLFSSAGTHTGDLEHRIQSA